MNRHEWRDVVLAADFPPFVKVAGFAVAATANEKTLKAYSRYSKIGERCGMAERTIRASVATLAAAGFLTVAKRRFGGPNELTLTLPQSGMTMPDSVASNPSSPCRSIRHDHAAQSGMTMPLHIEEPLSLNPVTEPSGPSEEKMGTDTEFVARPLGTTDEERAQNITTRLCKAIDTLFALTADNSFKVDGTYVDRWAVSQLEIHRAWPEIEALALAGKLPVVRLAALLEETGVAGSIRERLAKAA